MLDVKSLDPLIHAPMRLGIMTTLSQHQGCDFAFLKKTLDTSDGNLSTHIAKLESVGYLNVKKTFIGKLPNTSYSLTPSGEGALSNYLTTMRSLIINAEP